MKSEKSFRKKIFGGFNSRDVVDYLAQMSRERREETEALRAGADKLRRERDALLAERNAEDFGRIADGAAGPGCFPSGDTAALMEEREEMSIRFYEMRKERDALQSRLDAVLRERAGERESNESFTRERAAFESDRASMLDALTRREQERAELAGERSSWYTERSELLEERQRLLMERGGLAAETIRYKAEAESLLQKNRALAEEIKHAGAARERIEREEREAGERLENARAQAESARLETARLITETRVRFNEMMEKSRASALESVLELDRMRGFLARFPDRFAETEQILTQMENDPRPYVREFVPPAFDEAVSKSPSGNAPPDGDVNSPEGNIDPGRRVE
ncbi:MAG: hypothetical protein LBH95_04490 [Oscillospiraceae bacterium]|jgi:hypothetical protein|nr:hypothetical protein [Oscillospiraceae bacterium]